MSRVRKSISLLIAFAMLATICIPAFASALGDYPTIENLPAINTIPDPFKFFRATSDPTGDGYVSTPAEWTARRNEIKELVQRYWLGYRWPTRPEDVQGSATITDVPNTVTVGGFFGFGGTIVNLRNEYDKLVNTLKTAKVEIKEIIPPAGGWGNATLGAVRYSFGPAQNPADANELQSLAIAAWNAGYYIPYTNFGSQAYAALVDSTGLLEAPPPPTKKNITASVAVRNPDRLNAQNQPVTESFSVSIYKPTPAQIQRAWGSADAEVPFVVDIGGTAAFSALNLNTQGYALVTFNAGNIYPDNSSANPNRNGVYTRLYPYDKDKYENASGALMAWGWAVSQIISALGQPAAGGTATFGDLVGLDPTKTVVTGHSRYAKAAMFAAAFDDRISICVPSESGGSGIQSYRYKVEGKIFNFNTYPKADRVYGKTEIPTVSYGSGNSWFPETAAMFVTKDNQIPFDSSDIIALVAPRPFFTVTGIDSHWLGNEGGVAAVQAASEVYEYIGANAIEKGNIAVRARQSDHVFYPRDFCFALAIMDREFKQDADQTLHVKDLFPNGTGISGMSYPARDYQTVSGFNSYPFDINSSYLPWSSANKYTLWTTQENFLVGHSASITAHSNAPDVDLYLPDKTTRIDASGQLGDSFTFNLTPEQAVYGRYELRTAGGAKENRSVFFAAVSLADALRHAPSKGDEGEENRLIGFSSRLANTPSDAPKVYIGNETTPVSMSFTPERFKTEETTMLEYGVLFHDKVFVRIANADWDASKTFNIKNLKFVTIPGFTFEFSLNNIFASAGNSGKDGAGNFTKPISWNVERFNNGPAEIWPEWPDTVAERNSGGGPVRPIAPAPKPTNFKAEVTNVKAMINGDKTDVTISFSEPLNKGQFGFGLNVAQKWDTIWNGDGTQVTLSIANGDLTSSSPKGSLIIFRLMDPAGNLIGGPIEKTIDLPFIPSIVTDNKNGQADIDFDIKSANGKGYAVYLSETDKKGPYTLYENVNYNAKGVHIKGLTDGKTYWAYIVYTENGVAIAKSEPIRLQPAK